MSRRWNIGPLNAITALIAAVGLWMLWTGVQQSNQASDLIRQVVADRQAVAEGALSACRQSPQVAQILERNGTCARAEQVVRSPVPVAAPPDIDYQRVKEILVGIYRANPPRDGKSITPEQVLPLVSQVYLANKPADGHTPTDAELLALIRRVYTDNPPPSGKDGQAGTNGVDGHNAFCFDQPRDARCQPERGARGNQGYQGVSVTGARKERDQRGDCLLVFTLTNPATSATSEISVALPGQLCDSPPIISVPPLGR